MSELLDSTGYMTQLYMRRWEESVVMETRQVDRCVVVKW